MPRKKKEENLLIPLPDKNDPEYFNTLIKNCVKAYEKLSNDSLALDYCKVSDKKLRAMILNDNEYKAETKNIYARQRLEEINELEELARLAAGSGIDDEDDDYYEPRDGKKTNKKITGADKDMLNMQFKAAQMIRELRVEHAEIQGDNERDTVNFMFIEVTREEFERLLTIEIHEGSDDADIDALIGTKEDMPVGTGNMRIKGKTKVYDEDTEDYFDVLPNGEIVER